MREFITYLFGIFNRKENLDNSTQVLKYVIKEKGLNISSRFLTTYALMVSDMELRNRILFYQSQYYAVPLMYPCQVSFENRDQNVRLVPEVFFNMRNGFGVFNFGLGYYS